MAKTKTKKEESAFEKLQKFRSTLDDRIYALNSRQSQIMGDLNDLEQGLDEKILLGTHLDSQELISELNTELTGIQRELRALQNPSVNGVYGKLIEEVWQESVDLVQGPLRKRFDLKMKELEKIKSDYLSIVSELGMIKREADLVTNRTSNLFEGITTPRKALPSLATGINIRHDRKSGPIFLDEKIIAKIFQGG